MPATPKHEGEPVAAAIPPSLAALPPVARKRMQQIRAIIRAAAPGATEHFSYGIPAFRLEGQPLIWYAAFKSHTSLFPCGPALPRAYPIEPARDEPAKGPVRFPLDAPLPVAIVRRLVKARA